jgi:hypothetical protein
LSLRPIIYHNPFAPENFYGQTLMICSAASLFPKPSEFRGSTRQERRLWRFNGVAAFHRVDADTRRHARLGVNAARQVRVEETPALDDTSEGNFA